MNAGKAVPVQLLLLLQLQRPTIACKRQELMPQALQGVACSLAQ